LIGFYFHRKSASDAAAKAFITNRIGDAGFILGMFFIAWLCGSLRFIDVTAFAREHAATLFGNPYVTAALCCSSSEPAASRRSFRLRLAARRHGRSLRRSRL